MCSNYRPVTSLDRLLTFFGVERMQGELPPDVDVWPTGHAPFIRLHPDWDGTGEPRLLAEGGAFGLLPSFATELNFGKRTYNARSETVASLPSYRQAWRDGQRCIIPAEFIYEPCYESGVAVRWRIGQPGAVPFGIAGIYAQWVNPQTQQHEFSFSMLTVNADTHVFYNRMHRPGEEKRMPIILDPGQYGDWLTCGVAEARRFFQQWQGVFDAGPDPLAPRKSTPKPPPPPKPPKPAPPPTTGDLFGD
jgi:putative SOS response-associated peptidase YedK